MKYIPSQSKWLWIIIPVCGGGTVVVKGGCRKVNIATSPWPCDKTTIIYYLTIFDNSKK